ncbi:MAG: DHH family phosphoesterase [Oscillospiraceae bacterium]|nr:DHH family phosphoesterase [Oscillospiraceae bacterium]
MPLFIAVTFYGEFRLTGRWYVGAAETAVYLAALVIALAVRSRRRKDPAGGEALSFSADAAVNDSLLNMPAPIVLVKVNTGEMVWCNRAFADLTDCPKNYFRMPIREIVPGFELKWIIEGSVQMPELQKVDGRVFEVYSSLIRPEKGDYGNLFAALYWIEKTQELALRAELEENRLIVGELVCDNYEEISRGGTESDRASMMAELDGVLRRWLDETGAVGVLRKVDRDRYLICTDERSLRRMEASRFELLEKVKAIRTAGGAELTVSLGIGRDAENLGELERYSTLALEMALSRGGDQAVVKTKKGFDFFGGMTHEKEKHTKVKSRIMANVLRGLIHDSTDVYAMGHRVADMDSLGGAVGIVCAARKFGKRCRIIIDRDLCNAGQLIELLENEPAYRDVFLTPEQAMIEIKPGSLLVVVDTNRRNYVERTDLLTAFSKIAVIDHHRRVADYIDNAVLNIHEPTASSVCELIVEVLSYLLDPGDMLRAEASAMLAGIVLDTKSFAVKTGVRTFEAAAYLRRNGADSIEIKKMFQSDLASYIERAEIVKRATFFEGIYALSVSEKPVDRAVAAQAADDLMNIMGVAGSFVVFPFEDTISVSARSLGRINVQLIMEKLGGGGHFTTAGVQIKGKTADQVVSMLKDAITLYQYEQR